MLRFARYFFVVFLITAIIPLLLMFVINHHQMERMQKEKDRHFLDIGTKQLVHTTKQYLKIKEGMVLEKIQAISLEKLSPNQLKTLLNADKVEQVSNYKINKVTSYYEVAKPDNSDKHTLFTATFIPVKTAVNESFKVLEKADLTQLRPAGPFEVKIYNGVDVNKNTFIGVAEDPFLPPHIRAGFINTHAGAGFMKRNPPKFSPKGLEPEADRINLTNIDGQTVAAITITSVMHPGHPAPPPFENPFGLAILFAGSIFSIVIGFYINKNFINPLLILSNASTKVQEGDLSFELKTNIKQDQIIKTFDNFNQMVKGLKEKEELRKSFVTSLTHDLKTPLIAQERSLEFISGKFKKLDLKDEYELAKGLEKNNAHLLRMVNLILESYRFDSSGFELVISDINLSELIDGCFEKLKPLIDEKNIEFENNVMKSFPLIKGDATCLKRIFMNLMSNAVDNLPIKGKIKINSDILDNYARIYVEDSGSGITREDMAHIFDRYYTGKSFERKLGAGLGLYVCKKLTEMHNGEITVNSEIGKYTTFTVKLPLDVQKSEGIK
jgi:signal transduction histidine kinase